MESFRKKEIMGNLPLKTPRQAGTISKRSIENQVRPIKRDKKQVCLEKDFSSVNSKIQILKTVF